jgi:hypothetical protein
MLGMLVRGALKERKASCEKTISLEVVVAVTLAYLPY